MKSPYVSGPMTGYDYHNFPLFFRVEEQLRALGFTPLNPARNTGDTWQDAYEYALAHPQTWEAYIRKDTEAVLQSDGIVLLPGWEKSKGACIEVIVSVAIGNGLAFCMNDPYAPYQMTLVPIDREGTYCKALKYLLACGLGGVDLTADGFAKYA